jgi:16S rRNA (uracil1498-N3)-methyltransferase
MSLRVLAELGGRRAGAEVELEAEEAHYMVRVRRAAVGDAVDVLDPREGVRLRATITALRPAIVTLGELWLQPPQALAIELGVGVVEAPAMLDVICAAVELGVDTLVPLACAWAQPYVPGEARTARRITSAMRQCGRARALTIAPITAPAAWFEQDGPRWRWIADVPDAASDPRAGGAAVATAPDAAARIAVGPEAGFTPEERALARAAGFTPLALGPYVLRSPNAVVAAVAAARAVAAAAVDRAASC